MHYELFQLPVYTKPRDPVTVDEDFTAQVRQVTVGFTFRNRQR